MIDVTDESFAAEVLRSDVPVLVDFWAEWCAPCHKLAPILEDLSAEYEGRVRIVKIDADVNPQTARDYGVQGLPTLCMFRGGEVVSQISGLQPKSKLRGFIDGALAPV